MAKGNGIWKFIAGVAVLGWAFGGDDAPDNNSALSSVPQTTISKPVVNVVKPKAPQPKPQKIIKTVSVPKVIPATPEPSFNPKNMYVDASRLNVRNGPDKTNKVIWTLKQDQKVLVIGQSGDWLKVKGRRFEGWVFGSYLTNNPAPKPIIVKKKAPAKSGASTAKIKNLLIKRSHAYYSGNCPCPYNTTRAGRRCGKRSAYSRPGGASPLCYPSDVTASMVSQYRARQ